MLNNKNIKNGSCGIVISKEAKNCTIVNCSAVGFDVGCKIEGGENNILNNNSFSNVNTGVLIAEGVEEANMINLGKLNVNKCNIGINAPETANLIADEINIDECHTSINIRSIHDKIANKNEIINLIEYISKMIEENNKMKTEEKKELEDIKNLLEKNEKKGIEKVLEKINLASNSISIVTNISTVAGVLYSFFQ